MGIGFAQDKKISCNLYIKAAEMGHSGAMTALAVLYQEGDGYEKNLAKAERYLLAAAQKGESTAFYTIGYISNQICFFLIFEVFYLIHSKKEHCMNLDTV